MLASSYIVAKKSQRHAVLVFLISLASRHSAFAAVS